MPGCFSKGYKMAANGIFITFEGIEGSGKSSQISSLAKALKESGYGVVTTREPGGCPIADAIRSIVLDPANRDLDPKAELLLYAAARTQHVAEVIRPALAKGQIVLCDRYVDATYAYQGGGRSLDVNLIGSLNQVASDGINPDLTLLLDLPVSEGLQRARARNVTCSLAAESRFECESLAFHTRVRDAYLALAQQHPRFVVVDATGDMETVAARILQATTTRLQLRIRP
jgi:dTMP kinase